ncbi:7942_t:CDS:1, partial [Scutellospora calospora]
KNIEYNIHSNDNNTNKVIVAALEDLDNTFYSEYLDSKSDEESNSLSDNEPLSDINNNIPLNNLNEFDFVDLPDNYIEDKIYDELKLKI